MGQCHFSGQRDRSFFIVPGQDEPGQPIKIRDKTWKGTITNFLSKSRTGQGRDNHYFFSIISCFRTSLPVLERPFPVFWGGKWFCPGESRFRGVCPGIFAPALHLGQGDNGVRNYFCARTMGQQDVPLPFGQSNMHSKLISAQTSQEGIECTQTSMCN